MVMVKGVLQADGSLLATTLKLLDGPDEDENQDQDSGKANSAFCMPGKKTTTHPVALKIAQKYGVDPAWVMGYFCQGEGMGAIMLALKTQQLNGANPDDLLAQRASGVGWGKIWQGLGMIGSEKEVKTPPGQLKKGMGTDTIKTKKDKDVKIPPGQLKKSPGKGPKK